jgi:hypothetical protein
MITDLLRIEAPNPASVLKLSFTPVGAVTGWVEPIGGQFGSALTFRAGWRWFDLYGTPQTISFSEETKRDRGRVYYEVEAGGFLPNDSAAFRAQLQWMAYTRFYVKIKDQLGLVRVAGRPEQGLEMISDFKNESEMGGKRGYFVRFGGRVSLPAGVYVY